MTAELERVEDADAVSLIQEHRDQGRADVTGSAGDEYPHCRLHPWWLDTRLERRVCEAKIAAQGEMGETTLQALVPAGSLQCVAK